MLSACVSIARSTYHIQNYHRSWEVASGEYGGAAARAAPPDLRPAPGGRKLQASSDSSYPPREICSVYRTPISRNWGPVHATTFFGFALLPPRRGRTALPRAARPDPFLPPGR